MILTDDDIRLITRKRKSDAQCRALTAMGIPYMVRPDGSPVVFTADVATSTPRKKEPRLRL